MAERQPTPTRAADTRSHRTVSPNWEPGPVAGTYIVRGGSRGRKGSPKTRSKSGAVRKSASA